MADPVHLYQSLLDSVYGPHFTGVREEELSTLASARPPEIEIQSRWYAGDFGRDFLTTTGLACRIVQFGHWNHGAGPDFSEVVVEISGRRHVGTLELDGEDRDWERHGHAQNPHYESVVLHVFLGHAQPDSTFFTRTLGHRHVPQVRISLSSLQAADPSRVRAEAEAKCGRCSYPLKDTSTLRLHTLLEGAARHRMARKAARLDRIATIHGWDQALYQELAAALGYRQNKLAMTILAQRLPLSFLQNHKAGAEALLFGSAGFLETKVYETAAADTRDYLRELWETWWKHRPELSAMAPPPWVMSGSRPVNHPQRRTGALSRVAQQWKLIRPAIEGGSDALTDALSELSHPYWDWHYTLTSARSAKRLAVVGATRIRDVLANLGYPLWSLKQEQWWDGYSRLPASLENEKVRRAAIRLLGHRDDSATWTSKLWHQQALIQIYEDFCLRDHSDCAQCVFPEQLRSF